MGAVCEWADTVSPLKRHFAAHDAANGGLLK